jgi:hypothetical protein
VFSGCIVSLSSLGSGFVGVLSFWVCVTSSQYLFGNVGKAGCLELGFLERNFILVDITFSSIFSFSFLCFYFLLWMDIEESWGW